MDTNAPPPCGHKCGHNRLCTRDANELEVFLITQSLGVEVFARKKDLPALNAVINAFYLYSATGRCLCSLIGVLVDDLKQDNNGFEKPRIAAQFEQLLIPILLNHPPHNATKQLEASRPAPAPRDVKRVVDYVQAHLQESISLPELVAVSGVSGRSLNAHFRRFMGKSPLAYVTEQRLARTRQALQQAGPDDTVTEIATHWGFNHLGRFASLYRRTYGELPSETLLV